MTNDMIVIYVEQREIKVSSKDIKTKTAACGDTGRGLKSQNKASVFCGVLKKIFGPLITWVLYN